MCAPTQTPALDLGCDRTGRQFTALAGGVYVLETDGRMRRVCRLRSPNRMRTTSRRLR
jgi:hypothetical protein